MSTVHGVESNEASRFIDHTLATPWETLLSDIESALRLVLKSGETGTKVDIYYYGLTYKLEKRKSTNQKKTESKALFKSEHSKDYSWLQTTYGISWFILFSHGHHSGEYHAVYRTTMLSAFVTAVRNINGINALPIPTFFSYSYVTDIRHASDMIGYQIVPPLLSTTINASEQAVIKPRWCRYEAHTCLSQHFNPHFEYFDGIRKVLKNQFRVLRLAGPTAENYHVEADFSFIHEPSTIYGSVGQGSGIRTVVTPPGTPLRRPALDTTGVSIFNVAFLKRLADSIPADEVSSTLMTELVVDLAFPSQPQSAIIDNLDHTSYVASKQPPHCWSISVNFKNHPRMSLGDLGQPPNQTSGHRNPYLLGFHSAGSENGLSATWMSRCVRKLLAFYLLSVYCSRAKINIETMSAEIEATSNMLDKNTIDRIVEVLSDESKDVFYAVCRQQIDAKLAPAAPMAPASPLPTTSATKGRMASVQKDAAPGNLTSPGGLVSPSKAVGRTASVATPSGGVGVGGGMGNPAASSLSAVATNLFGDDGWTARMERHRTVVEILFSGECVFSPDVSRWSSLDVPVSSSVGLWMGMFSILCASSAVDAHDMATIWSKCIRRVHIACEDGQVLPTFTPTSRTDLSDTTSGKGEKAKPPETESVTPICLRTLWDDTIERMYEEDTQRSSSCQSGLLLAWPDQKESIVLQKLQQLQFCIATQNESPVYHFPAASVDIEVVEIATPAEDAADMSSEASATDGREVSTDHPPRPKTTHYKVQQPALFRRLPLTEDMLSMNKYLARKLNLTNSRSNKEHPTLKVQLQIPSILSDIKAFKAANPNLSLQAFCQWYGIELVPPSAVPIPEEQPTRESSAPVVDRLTPASKLRIPLEDVSLAWSSCEPLACEEQGRALFQVEKESEKALAFLEAVSAVQLSSEMLVAGTRLLYGIIAKQFDPWLAAVPADCQPTPALSAWQKNLRSDLTLLKEQVENAASSLQPLATESSSNSSSSSSSSSAAKPVEINIEALILVDSVAGLIQKLETLSIKLQTLGSLLKDTSARQVDAMIHTLARRDSCTAESEAEMSALYEMTKALHNFKDQTHDWQSRDGRELGDPTKKTFTCRLSAPTLCSGGAAGGTTRALSVPLSTEYPAPASSAAPSGAVQTVTAAAASATTQAAVPLAAASSMNDIFQMEVTVKQKQLRIAFRVPED